MSQETILLGEGVRTVRRTLRAALASKGYEVIEAVDGIEAISLANRHHPDAAVLDTALAEVNGIRVCERLKQDPETAPIPVLLLGDRPDRSTVVRSVKAGAADFLVRTGISVEAFADRVAKMLSAPRADGCPQQKAEGSPSAAAAKPESRAPSGLPDAAAIERKLERVAEAKALPFLATEIISMTADRGSSAKDLVNLVERDQAIAAKLLKLANSSYYSAQGRSSSVSHAVSKLGFNGVRETVLGMVMIEGLGELDGSHLDRAGFWRHSLAVAALTKMFSEAAGLEGADSAMVAGLVHDIGKAVADDFLEDAYGEALRRARDGHLLLREAEEKVLGIDHTHIGARIAKRWRLPDSVFGSIAYHHLDWDAVFALPKRVDPGLVAMTKLADILAHARGHGDSGEQMIEVVPLAVCKKLGLTEERVERALGGLDSRLKELEQIFMLYQEPSETESPGHDAGGAPLLLLSRGAGASSLQTFLGSCVYDVARSESLPDDLLASPPAAVVFEAEMASRAGEVAEALGHTDQMPRLVAVGAAADSIPVTPHVLSVLPAPFSRVSMVEALGLACKEAEVRA